MSSPLFSIEELQDLSISKELMTEVVKEVSQRRESIINQKHVMLFKHGMGWTGYVETRNSEKVHNQTKLRRHSTEVVIPVEQLKSADFGLIDSVKLQMVEGMTGCFTSHLVEVLDDATKDQPAINLSEEGDIREGLRSMLSNIKLSLNEDLSLAKPNLLIFGASGDKMLSRLIEIDQSDPEFKKELEQIQFLKWREALREYFGNLQKFKLSDEDRDLAEYRLQQLSEASESGVM